jgi:hypothetical protein
VCARLSVGDKSIFYYILLNFVPFYYFKNSNSQNIYFLIKGKFMFIEGESFHSSFSSGVAERKRKKKEFFFYIFPFLQKFHNKKTEIGRERKPHLLLLHTNSTLLGLLRYTQRYYCCVRCEVEKS